MENMTENEALWKNMKLYRQLYVKEWQHILGITVELFIYFNNYRIQDEWLFHFRFLTSLASIHV